MPCVGEYLVPISWYSTTQVFGAYVGCMSLYLDFGFDALECCHSECRVSCINSLFPQFGRPEGAFSIAATLSR